MNEVPGMELSAREPRDASDVHGYWCHVAGRYDAF